MAWSIDLILFAVPNVSFRSYEKNFFQRFIESHVVLINGNSALKPKEGEATSKPWMWPINLRVLIEAKSKNVLRQKVNN